jgi:hypothetical protein
MQLGGHGIQQDGFLLGRGGEWEREENELCSAKFEGEPRCGACGGE